MSHSAHTPSPWQELTSRVLLHTPIFDVDGIEFRHPQRSTQREFVVISAPDWVNIIALTPAKEIILVRQFRYGSKELSWEIPGGVIEKNGETPLQAGLRELREETAYVSHKATLLASIRPNPAILNNHCHFILAEEAELDASGTQWDADEELETRLLPLDEAYQWAKDGKINHALVLNALLFLKLKRPDLF